MSVGDGARIATEHEKAGPVREAAFNVKEPATNFPLVTDSGCLSNDGCIEADDASLS